MNSNTVQVNTPDWELLYQQKDTGWDRGCPSPALQAWIDQSVFYAGQKVLVPGCGYGYEVLALAQLGCQVTALDLSVTALKALQAKLDAHQLQATLVCDDLFAFQADQFFDLVYEQTCLCAIPLDQRQAYQDCLYGWLKPEGILCFLMMQTGSVGGPPFHCDWLDMRQLFAQHRWQWQDRVPMMIPRPTSSRFELAFQLRKKEDFNDAMAL